MQNGARCALCTHARTTCHSRARAKRAMSREWALFLSRDEGKKIESARRQPDQSRVRRKRAHEFSNLQSLKLLKTMLLFCGVQLPNKFHVPHRTSSSDILCRCRIIGESWEGTIWKSIRFKLFRNLSLCLWNAFSFCTAICKTAKPRAVSMYTTRLR